MPAVSGRQMETPFQLTGSPNTAAPAAVRPARGGWGIERDGGAQAAEAPSADS